MFFGYLYPYLNQAVADNCKEKVLDKIQNGACLYRKCSESSRNQGQWALAFFR